MKPGPFNPDSLDRVLRTFPASARLLVAFSGGPDSTALLHALSRLQWSVLAIHVDHGLDPGSGDRAGRAEAMARAWGVPIRVQHVQVPGKAPGGLEQAARKARYRALLSGMAPGEVLLTAHHADDQAETVLLRLLRGSGPTGLAGIRPIQSFGPGWLARPLLDWPGQALATYLEEAGLESLDDPGNRDWSRDRNFLRHRILPRIHERWPAAARSIGRSAGLLQGIDRRLAGRTTRQLDRARAGSGRLHARPITGLDRESAARILRQWLGELGWVMPPAIRLDTFVRQLQAAGTDRRPCLGLAEGRLVRDGEFIHALDHRPEPGPFRIDWDGRQPLELPHRRGCLDIRGNRDQVPHTGTWPVTVCSRGGGERIRLGPAHRRPVKKLFQEAGIPVHERALFPFIHQDGRLVAVGDRWLDPDFKAGLDALGQRLVWERPETVTILTGESFEKPSRQDK